nr:MAG TPA: hypothetical protein [Caudoviricetes sp.]
MTEESYLGRFRTYIPLPNIRIYTSLPLPHQHLSVPFPACRTPRVPSSGCTYISPSVSSRSSSACAYKLFYIGPWSQSCPRPCRHWIDDLHRTLVPRGWCTEVRGLCRKVCHDTCGV